MNPEDVLFQIIPSIVGLRTILNSTFERPRRDMDGLNVAHEVSLAIEVSSRGAALPSASEDRSRIIFTISSQIHGHGLWG